MKNVSGAILMMLNLIGCRAKQDDIKHPIIERGNFLYVLNEGLFQHNNSTLTRYNLDNQTIERDFFGRVNQLRLGDTGNDIAIYGSKLYILITVSSQLFVAEASSGKLIQRIPILNERNLAREPRQMVFDKGKVYISCFDGYVLVLDTINFQVIHSVYSGRNPEGIAIQNQKLYVANSGGKDFPNYDSTLSIFELSSLRLLKKIAIGVNPTHVLASPKIANRVFICLKGNYADIPQRWIGLDAVSDTVLHISFRSDLQYIIVENELVGAKQEQQKVFMARYDAFTGSLINSFILSPSIQTLYGLCYLSEIQSIIFSDAKGYVNVGMVYLCDIHGKVLRSFQAELNPAHYAFFSSFQ